jgi:hypothetical protein
MDTWKLAYVRMKEAEKIAQDEWHIRQAIAASKPAKNKNKQNLRFRFEALKGSLLCYWEGLYCRTLSFIHPKSS